MKGSITIPSFDKLLNSMSRKDADFQADNKKDEIGMISSFGDPYENRTRVTAVKGPCLNRLTNGPIYLQSQTG